MDSKVMSSAMNIGLLNDYMIKVYIFRESWIEGNRQFKFGRVVSEVSSFIGNPVYIVSIIYIVENRSLTLSAQIMFLSIKGTAVLQIYAAEPIKEVVII